MNNALLSRILELTSQFHLRPGRETSEDAQAFVDLMNGQYARKVTPAYYFWQFFRAPSARACLMAELESRVVAAYGLWVLPFCGPTRCCVGLATDLIVAPEFRGTGLFFRLELEMERVARNLGCVCIYAAPNEPAYQPRVEALGWHAMPSRIDCVAPTVSLPGTGACAIAAVDACDLEICASIADQFRANHSGRVMCQRGADYLTWRLSTNPRYEYELFVARRQGEPFGYMALKIFKDPQTGEAVGDIVDLVWGEDVPAALGEMLRFALAYFRDQGVPCATIWLQSDTILDEQARTVGFAPITRARRFCCKVFDNDYEWLDESSRWFITMVDAEIY
jgi:GNAT superfamily N-acetyltransferase